ncbi:MAG: RNA 2',3'-cyclic phosphodiesterase [bacterium]
MESREKGLIRSFISIDIEGQVREKIRGFQEELIKKVAEMGIRVSWTRPESIHLTLKFLGDIPVNHVNPILDALKRAVAGVETFTMKIEGLGAFPNFRNPRVIWIGISEGAESLQKLQPRIEQELVRLRFPKEKKRFNAHLTMGRIRSEGKVAALSDILASIPSPVAGLTAVRDIRLMKSELHPSGAIYTELGRISLVRE